MAESRRAKPHHDAPSCPRCGDCAGVPAAIHPQASPRCTPDHLICAACGHDWLEDDQRRVAQAWWATGAWEGRQDALDEPALPFPREMEDHRG